MAVVAAHYGPRRPNRALLARYPRLTNEHVLKAKLALRDLIVARVGAERAFNAVHSSDDEFETWEYVAIALPGELAALRDELRRRRDDYRTTAPVMSVLRKGRRAKVEVVEGQDGQPVVRKTFAPLGRRHLEREVATMRELAPKVDAVPRLLRTGPNWFETQLFNNSLAELPDRPDGRLVPLRVARAMVQVLREVHAQGYDLIDAKPQNFLVEPNGQLRLVDYEFSHRYQTESPDFEHIYSFVGPPEDYDGDLPVGELSYEGQWQPFVGLSRDSLLHDPVWRQRLKRGTFRVAYVGRTPLRLARSGARQGRTGLRTGRAWAGARYRRWARERARILL